MKVSKSVKDREIIRTMKWITLNEACLYARKSINSMVKLIVRNKIYGTKRDGEWIVDRESIDAYYNCERDEMRIRLHGRAL